MAPRKRKAEDNGEAKTTALTTTTTTRVTRSMARLGDSGPKKKLKGKATKEKKKDKGKDKYKDKDKVKEEEKPREEEVAEEKVEKEVEEEEEVIEAAGPTKTIVVEHCKQCNSFKTRATQVKAGLEKAVPGITVLLNPDKPRRGCFEIREEGGEKFISLLDMKRPFQPMKALDMEQVISDIVDKIKG